MVQHIGAGLENNFQRLMQALKVRNQNFNPAARRELANVADSSRENPRPANVVVVSINTCNDSVLQAESRHCLRNAARFISIDRPRLAFRHSTEAATASADVA